MTDLNPDPSEVLLASGGQCEGVEVLAPRLVPLGGLRAMTVHRTLPQRGRSLVGAWCFLDHYGPDDVSETGGMSVSRHPHTGLATVSWLFTGQIDHLDSGGVAAAVLPGELNLMIAGRGITHQEISTRETRVLHGVQLWYALPDETRFGDNGFEHYAPEPVEVAGMTARVFIGELLGSVSPVETRTPELLGAELLIEPGAVVEIETRHDFEYALLAENQAITVNDQRIEHRSLGYVPTETDRIKIEVDAEVGAEVARVIFLGGVPFGEEIIMWWNFIGREHEEVVEYRRRYQSELGFDPVESQDEGKPALFGDYPEGQPAPIPAPVMPLTKLKPRK